MLLDHELALLCQNSYVPPFSIDFESQDLACTISDHDEERVVAFRGTTRTSGWMRDFDALPKSHPVIGYVHDGFLSGASALLQRLDVDSDGKKIVLTGHSLGGALAVVVGALRIAGQRPVDRIVTFGAPRAGYVLQSVLASVAVRQYRRGNDPVPTVPLDLLMFPYKHAREPLISVGVPDVEEPWRCHDIRGYAADIAAIKEA